MPSVDRNPSSYRDPSGFLFYKNGILYRQVNQAFKEEFDQFIKGGLYTHLVEKKLLLPHQIINENLTNTSDYHTTLQPEKLTLISYPYEWCFDMLKDAALLTIEIAKAAMSFGMMLKDASAYNIQFYKGKLIFIDTLSFEQYNENRPWIAYRQFCEHFFAPLALMHYLKEPLQNLFIAYPDGVPLHIASKMLPLKSKFNLHSYLHLHLQGQMSKKISQIDKEGKSFSKKKMNNLLRSLEESINGFSLTPKPTTWSRYYEEANQRGDYLDSKFQIVEQWLDKLNAKTVLDAGANEGEFSKLAAKRSAYVISTDQESISINNLYRNTRQNDIANIHPLIIDIVNPSPGLGMSNEERIPFLKRIRVDLVLVLALIHHLAIGRNIPFDAIASMFHSITKYLIIEFVPADDEKVRLISIHKKNLLDSYTDTNFINAFKDHFSIVEEKKIGNSGRTLYLMEKHDA